MMSNEPSYQPTHLTPVSVMRDGTRGVLAIVLSESDEATDHPTEIEDKPEHGNRPSLLMRQRTGFCQPREKVQGHTVTD
jgi:hypothetical protein